VGCAVRSCGSRTGLTDWMRFMREGSQSMQSLLHRVKHASAGASAASLVEHILYCYTILIPRLLVKRAP
jgi:hypothetical protein